MPFIPGFCVNHPTIAVAPGQKYKCEACVNRPAPKEPQFLSSEESATIAAEQAKKPEEKKKRGRPADPEKVAARLQKQAEVAERKAAREAKKAKEEQRQANLPSAFHNFEEIPEDDLQDELDKAILEGKTPEEIRVFEKHLKEHCYVCGQHKGGFLTPRHGWVKSASDDRIVPLLKSVTEMGISL